MAVPGPKAADVPAPLPSDGTASADSGWQIYWPTYLWAAGANGSARTLPPFPRADIDLSFGDSLEAMKDLDAGLITSMFVNNGRFRMMGDVSWMRLSPEDQFKVGDTTAKLSTFLCSSAVGKDLAQSCYEARRAVRFGELVEIFLAEHVANLQPGTTVEYIRAETDVAIADFQRRANGKINTYAFVRQPTFLDDQPVTRMNRDTLYGSAVIDTEGGATITVPKADDGRYLSVLVIDNDHYAPAVSYSPGTYNLPHDMRFVALLYRVQLLDYADPKDVVAANALQDSFVVNASSTASFPALQWDVANMLALRAEMEWPLQTHQIKPGTTKKELQCGV